MRRWMRWALGRGVLLALAAGALATWEGFTASAPAAGPARAYDVRIWRDGWGVPHIVGRRDADVAYGLAWAHAEDDFTTLQEVLASTRGRAGALTGTAGATMDFALAVTDARAVTERRYKDLPEDVRALLEAYAQGLNRSAAARPQEVRLRNLFPVTGRDVAAGFVLRTPFFYGLDRVLAPLVEGKLPPRDAGPVNPAEQGAPPPLTGSNAFAVTGARSGDGVTRLIANSHQPWTGPVAWWEVVVHSGEGWDFAGALFPGAPFPLLGHNRALGWTNTVNRPDLVDTYRLVLDGTGERYRLDGRWLPLVKARVWLRVKWGPFTLPVPRTLWRSVHGPVIKNDLGAFALRYAGFGEVGAITQYYRLNKARGFDEWMAAMRTQSIAATNFVYADARGNIALIYNAKFPDRAAEFDWKGVLPGDTSRALWTRYLPFGRYPMVVNPRSGWVANSNNMPFVATGPGDELRPDDFAPEMGIESNMTNRAWRFDALLDQPGPITRERLLSVKFDKGYDRRSWAGVWMARLLAAPAGDDARLARAQALLRTWDWTLDGRGAADTLAAMAIGEGYRQAYRGNALPDARAALADVAGFLTEHWGRLDPPLDALMRVRRGSADVGTTGGPDALRAFAWERQADGRLAGFNGDSFIMLVEWRPDGGVVSRSVQPFGAAIERPGSPHYNDQAALFAAERWKPVLFTPTPPPGTRVYRPG